ncbi:glucose 1-dehydrogenase [Iningainema tapete]|uniref:Glucose 1-dehydrogenase n=1 Tax=Iningainema tapete BLCC-T55 TaxID=2748662 RepID=A0A8J7BWK3_9CYAN|nr:glucose 1-dehydrogenase [Iningainema tapete]MBD2771962.1 glucose 1-dehydrogenase [Iningainema tapete BLCC-T55]
MAKLDGKVAIVTGASRGIGKAITQRLTQDGAAVVINYGRSADEAEELVSSIESQGGKALAVQADMSQVADIRRLFQETMNKFGQLDILVNNAGIAKAALIAEVTEEDFDAVYAVNVRGVLFALQEAARHINDNGRIVIISSTTSVYPSPGLAVYASSKAAVKLFTEILAAEVGGRGITVNSVLPGPTTPGMFEKRSIEEQQAAAKSSPFNRIGRGEDIADVVAFLASVESRWITGQHIVANGGAKI